MKTQSHYYKGMPRGLPFNLSSAVGCQRRQTVIGGGQPKGLEENHLILQCG